MKAARTRSAETRGGLKVEQYAWQTAEEQTVARSDIQESVWPERLVNPMARRGGLASVCVMKICRTGALGQFSQEFLASSGCSQAQDEVTW